MLAALEAGLEPRSLQLLGEGCLTGDLREPGAMVRMDLTDIGYLGGSFDVICRSHVLEHVRDDRRAGGEFRRVLERDG